jgi:putative transcriptional regulator
MELAAMSKAGNRILSSVRAARASLQGGGDGGLAHVPDTVDVRAIRLELGLSQDAFAKRFGLGIAAVRDWEQQRRQPEQAARVLLTVIAHEPTAVDRALAAAQA